MSQWESILVTELCQIKPPKKEAKEKLTDTELVSFVPMSNLGICAKNLKLNEEKPLGDVVGSYTYFADNDVLLAKITPCFENGKLGIAKGLTNGIGFGSSEFIVFRSRGELDPEYLFYFLSQDSFRVAGAKVMTGAVGHKRVPKEFIENIEIPFPPLPEQKRIVAILDEAFAGISQAIANAEKNLANARDLFESYLNNVFTQKGGEWVERRLRDLGRIQTGSTPKTSQPDNFGNFIPFIKPADFYIDGNLNYNNAGLSEQGLSGSRLIKANSVLMVCIGATIGKVGCSDKDVASNQQINALTPDKGISSKFLYYQMLTLSFQSAVIYNSGQATLPIINKTKWSNLTVVLPLEYGQQKDIVSKLDDLQEKTQQLGIIYKQKLATLAELKQSILQKAFAGELTAGVMIASSKTVEVETTSPEFTARVLAFAHHRHVSQQRDKTFGRVKAQKILHLTESIGGINLGRKPIKDAAGPNDFKHMLRAEDWAKANQFFEFVERDNGYDFKKLGCYDEMMAEALTITSPYQKKLDRIIDLLLLMNSRKAEIFTTVHAAWNNLILNGDKITDEAIIREARENWHPDKMKIPVSEFREAIRLIHNKELVPDGKAKRVSGQENLF